MKQVLEMWEVVGLIDGCAIASVIISVFLIPNFWGVIISSSFVAFSFYWYYVRYVKKKKPRYALVSPEGKADFYLPRTNIPNQCMRISARCKRRNESKLN